MNHLLVDIFNRFRAEVRVLLLSLAGLARLSDTVGTMQGYKVDIIAIFLLSGLSSLWSPCKKCLWK